MGKFNYNFLKKYYLLVIWIFYRLSIKIFKKSNFLKNPIDTYNLLQFLFDCQEEFSFIQIGAHDGVSHDTLYEFVTSKNSRGIVVEPILDYYLQLCENYKNFPKVVPVNMAIHQNNETVILYKVNPKYKHLLPMFAPGIASIYPDHHLKTNIPKEYITTESCISINIMELFAKMDIRKIDYLQIDTEGYDFEVIKQIDFQKITPTCIKYEHANLCANDNKDAHQLLKKLGYSLLFDHYDTIAINYHLYASRKSKK